MYVVELTFDDNPARLAARPKHRELLAEMRDRGVLKAAGPWEDGTGALLIFDVDSEEELDKVMSEDPYYLSPGLAISSKRRWQALVI